MDDNQEEVTKHPELDPTLSVASNPYTDPAIIDSTEKGSEYFYSNPTDSTEKGLDYYSNPYASQIPPPPPKWNTKKKHPYRHYIIGICTFLIVCMIGATIFFVAWQKSPTVASHHSAPFPQKSINATATALHQPKSIIPSPTPTKSAPVVTPTSSYRYTAMDIMQHIQGIDKNIFIESTNDTIWNWSQDNYFISVHASSSVQWIGCPFESQQCTDTWHVGLWVYPDGMDARSAWQQVASDSIACSASSSTSSAMYVSCGQQEAEYLHGRCLLLGTDSQSIYGQVVTKYCQ